MMRGKAAVAMTLAAIMGAAHADEPLAIFGVPFNAPLAMPECSWKQVRDYGNPNRKAMKREYGNSMWSDNGGLCYAQNMGNIGNPIPEGGMVTILFPLKDQPSLSKRGMLGTRIVGGRAEYMEFYTNGIRTQSDDLDTLIEKFGNPAVLNRPVVQNRMGASFETVEATWNLPDNITVSYSSTLTQIDEGLVTIATPEGAAAEKRWQEEFKKRFGGTNL